MGDSPAYPVIVRNRTPYFARGLMLLFVGFTAMFTYLGFRDRPADAGPYLPYIMLLFWLVGLGATLWSFNQEAAELRVTGPRSLHIRRGKAFRRVEHWTDHARFWIVEEKDSDGDPYFKLLMDAPGGKLTVAEGHYRPHLEQLQARIEAAVR